MYWEFNGSNKFIDKKSFSNVHFTMTLPQASLFDERIDFDFSYKFKPSGEKVNSLLIGVRVIDVFNKTIYAENNTLLKQSSFTKVNVGLECDKKPSLLKSQVDFLYLCSNGIKVMVSYYYEKTNVAELLQIERCDMTDEEKNRYLSGLLLSKGSETHTKEPEFSNEGMGQYEEWDVPSSLEEYVTALKKEVLFLKNSGGKKYKITNGVRLLAGKEGYCYLFEMESELYLPDDTPISLETNAAIHAVGSVLHCEDFQILIIVDKDLGEKVYYSYVSVEPWKLLVAQEECIRSINPYQHKLAVKLINEGPARATKQSIDAIDRGQEIAKKKVLEKDITVIWGPPGTGKTHVMSEIAIDFISREKKVLVVSHSNVSVDGVIKKIAEMLRRNGQGHILEQGKVLRYGYVRDPELSQDTYATSFNFALSHCYELQRKLDVLMEEKDSIKCDSKLNGAKLVTLEKQIKDIRGKIREEEKFVAQKAQLLGTTVSKITVDSIFEDKKYDLVMFDEVSMAYVTQIICAATKAREKFVCVGDFKQLPSIAQEPKAKEILCKDIFEYLRICNRQGDMFNHPWLVMLDEQRRMHPDIAEFVSKRVYKSLLKNHESTHYEKNYIVDASPLSGRAMNIVDLSATYASAWKNADNSRFNILSAIISFANAIAADTEDVKSVGIICPYAAQTRLIRAMIKDYSAKDSTRVTCATVHQFQGSESDVIVFDAVESYPTSKAGFLMSKDLGVVQRLINVALTRARGKFINVCYGKFWAKEFETKKNHIYYQLVNYMLEKHNVISHRNKNLQEYIRHLDAGKNIRLFVSYKDSIELVYKDFEKAQHKIIISIPDGQLLEDANPIMEAIKKAEARGVDIFVKCNTFEQLPDEWKRYSVGTVNAVFPLILIDDNTMWYGIPASKGEFKVGEWSFVSVCTVIARIKGENTVEMIKSLTELEMKQVGMNKVPLEIKHSFVEAQAKGKPGLAKYVSEKKFCPKCKQHLVMVKGRTGKFYLRCFNTSCDHTEFLTKELVNHYIDMNNVVCPQDGANIHAGLGQFGIYVRCEGGHYLKPDQI